VLNGLSIASFVFFSHLLGFVGFIVVILCLDVVLSIWLPLGERTVVKLQIFNNRVKLDVHTFTESVQMHFDSLQYMSV